MKSGQLNSIKDFMPNAEVIKVKAILFLNDVKKFERQIYYRWGGMVFTTTGSDSQWDGTFRGQECKQDVYNYKLVLLNVKEEEKVYAGTVMLYR